MALRDDVSLWATERGRALTSALQGLTSALHTWQPPSDLPDEVATRLATDRVVQGSRWRLAILNVGSLVALPFTVLPRVTEIVWETTWQRLRATYLPAVLSPAELATAQVQSQVDPQRAESEAALSGLSLDRYRILVESAGGPPGAGELLDLLNRGELTEEQVDQGLLESRLKNKWIGAVKALRHVLPSPSDLIRYAVREAFDPAQVRELGLDQEFPERFAEEAAKRGMSRQHALWEWIAHWQLPSPSQAFQMLHRHLISPTQLGSLLRAHDYSPVWRDKLQAISYERLGRVDIRRFHAGGVISDAELPALWEAQGLAPDDARKAAAWTIQYNAEHGLGKRKRVRDLSVEVIRESYRDALIPAQEYLWLLQDAGYAPDEAVFLQHVDDFRRNRQATSELEAALKRIYVLRQIDTEEVTSRLQEAGYTEERIGRLLPAWQLLRHSRELTEDERHHRGETVAIVLEALEAGSYPPSVAQQHLEVLGFSSELAALIIANKRARSIAARRRETIALVRDEYLSQVIDRLTASNALDLAQVPPDQRDALLIKWELERNRQFAKLTVVQLGALWDAKLLTTDQLTHELQALNYRPEHVRVLTAYLTVRR